MTPLDWTDIFDKYRGKWVAFKSDRQTVVGSGDSLRAAKKEALDQGYENPITTRLPRTLRKFVG